MKLVLNIYSRERDENGNRIISKTYKANDYDCCMEWLKMY